MLWGQRNNNTHKCFRMLQDMLLLGQTAFEVAANCQGPPKGHNSRFILSVALLTFMLYLIASVPMWRTSLCRSVSQRAVGRQEETGGHTKGQWANDFSPLRRWLEWLISMQAHTETLRTLCRLTRAVIIINPWKTSEFCSQSCSPRVSFMLPQVH